MKLLNIFKFLIGMFSKQNSITEVEKKSATQSLSKNITVEKPIIIIEDPLATTDVKEKANIEKEIITQQPSLDEEYKLKKHFLPKTQYFKGPTIKKWAFGHHTAGWHNPYKVIDSWGRDNRGKVATEYVLGGQKITDGNNEFDGILVKAFPDGGWGWHLGIGRRELHSNSIGIELNNFGYLTKGGYYKRIDGKKTWIRKQPGKFYTYVGTKADPNQVIELEQKFRGYKYWHNYSDAQIEKLKVWLLEMEDRYNINPRKGLVDLIKEKGVFEAFDFCNVEYVQNNPGFYLHTNVKKGKVDLYPHPKLVEMLLNL